MRLQMLSVSVLLAGISTGCVVEDSSDDVPPAEVSQEPVPVQPAPPLPVPVADSLAPVRFVVDISDRMLHVVENGDTIRSEPVAVGTSEHPTPTGEWTIHRVDWNPDWTPPPGEEWTEDKEPQPPGAPLNPMGRARLVFNPPYTVHGTKENQSLGKAASHGSIRVANETVVQLGRLVMEAGGATRDESFFRQVETNRKEMFQVDIPKPVPITVQQ